MNITFREAFFLSKVGIEKEWNDEDMVILDLENGDQIQIKPQPICWYITKDDPGFKQRGSNVSNL